MRITTVQGKYHGRLSRARGARHGGPWIGPTGLRLALVIVAIALAAIGTMVAVTSASAPGNAGRLVRQQGAQVTRAVALASAAAYRPAGWDREDLSMVLDTVRRSGAVAQIRGHGGQVIRSSPGFGRFPSVQVQRQPVVSGDKDVGSVTVKFGHRGLVAAVAQYGTFRWQVGIAATGSAVLIALVISYLVSRTLTAPVDRLIRTVRAMEAGDIAARLGTVRGAPEVRELSAAFDMMADSMSEERRLRRNMAADLAHELRAPIAILQADLESMQDGLTEPTPRALTALSDEVVRLAQLADDLGALQSVQVPTLHLQLARHDLAAVAAEAADSLASAFRTADVRLIRRLSPIDVFCDTLRMHEVVVNLLGNAVKFTAAGGSVVLETGPAPQSGEHAMLRVSDTGIGIPADELPHVSRRFFRGQRAAGYSGSGIGLAIVDQLARTQHGSMDIVSDPGKGTQVSVMLPRAASDSIKAP